MTRQSRFLSLDFFRGFCVLGMILVPTTAWYSLKAGSGDNAGLYVWRFSNFVAPGFIMLIGMMVGFHYFPAVKTAEAVRKTIRRLIPRAGQIILIIYGFSIPWRRVPASARPLNRTSLSPCARYWIFCHFSASTTA